MLRIGIVGAGLIGKKRAAAIKGAKLVAVSDVAFERAESLAQSYSVEAVKSSEDLIARKDIDAVIISTTNDAIPPLTISALRHGKNVLVEKPAGRNPTDLKSMIAASKSSPGVLSVGFNHRFHPAFQKAKKMIDNGDIGPLMYIRARYGHGARVGYDQEWRANPALSGGGELLDQGVHLIDLCRWLGGEFNLEFGKAETFFWNMPVEDNGFLLLKSPDKKRSAFLHASCTEWKNLFDFEIFGITGKLQIFGLGRSYGVEELRFYKMKPEMGPPDFEVTQFPGEDTSWDEEFQSFLSEINGKKSHIADAQDALRAIEIVYDAYSQSNMPWSKVTQPTGSLS